MAKLGQYNLEEIKTEQEVFDLVRKHLEEQSAPSVGKDASGVTVCKYDGEDGKCCAAAIFIQDYKPQMENKVWRELVGEFGQSYRFQILIQELQLAHDLTWQDPTLEHVFPEALERELRRVAKNRGLQYV